MTAVTSNEPSGDDLQSLVADALAAYDDGGETALSDYLRALGERATPVRAVLGPFLAAGLLTRPDKPAAFPDRLGDFKLLRRLGAGGMGVVFVAEQMSLRREVALKVLRPEFLLIDGARERFRREIDAIASLRHPGIVPILAVGEEHDIPYFAMELVEGRSGEAVIDEMRGTATPAATSHGSAPASAGEHRSRAHRSGIQLWHLLRQDSAPPGLEPPAVFHGKWWETCVRLCHQLAQTMQHVHLRGIVHRDLKPSNVMLTLHGEALVLDFGLAQVAAHDRITRTGSELGSPAYMSPEQVRGEPLDARTDIYSLGATLFELLCFVPPFVGRDAHDLRARILAGVPPKLHAHDAALPRDLETVCLKAIDPERHRRYASMAEFAADLAAVADGRPIHARPSSLRLRFARWAKRHRALAVSLGALLVFVVLVPLLLWLQQREATRRVQVEYRRAQRSLEVSKEAVQTMLVRVGDVDLAETPGAEKLRARLLEDAASLYERLVADQSSDPALRHDRARTLEQLAKMLVDLGRYDDAYRVVEDTIEATSVPGSETDAELLSIRASSYQTAAALRINRGDFDQAITALDDKRHTIDLWRRLTPNDYRIKMSLGSALNSLADCHRRRNRDEAATGSIRESLLREAAALFESVRTEQPGVSAAGRSLAGVLQELAFALQALDRHDEALRVLERGLAIASDLPEERNARPRTAERLMLLHSTVGITHFEMGDFAAAAVAHGKSIEFAEQLVRDFPNTGHYRSRLGSMTMNLGMTELRIGNNQAAMPLLERAISHQQAALALAPAFREAHHFMMFAYRGLLDCHRTGSPREQSVAVATAMAAAADKSRDLLHAVGALIDSLQQPETADTPPHATRQVVLDQALALLLAAEQRGWLTEAALDHERFVALDGLPAYAELRARLASGR